jgi:hypothetical protein
MAEIRTVEPEEILPAGTARVELSPLQRVGVYGAVAVGCVGAALLFFLLGRWAWLTPHPPVIPNSIESATAKSVIDSYNAIREAVLDDTTRLADALVVKLLLPIFTSFVGYIFGSHSRKES